MEIIFMLAAFVAGFAIAYFIGQKKIWSVQKNSLSENNNLKQELAALKERNHQLTTDNERKQDVLNAERYEKEQLLQTAAAQKSENGTLHERLV